MRYVQIQVSIFKGLSYCNLIVATVLLMQYWTISMHELVTAEIIYALWKYIHIKEI